MRTAALVLALCTAVLGGCGGDGPTAPSNRVLALGQYDFRGSHAVSGFGARLSYTATVRVLQATPDSVLVRFEGPDTENESAAWAGWNDDAYVVIGVRLAGVGNNLRIARAGSGYSCSGRRILRDSFGALRTTDVTCTLAFLGP